MTIVIFILMFGLLVFVHEFGHFLLAKASGITVLEFSIGMGPKLLGFTRNGTLYSLRLFPIGGACMFEGEDGKENEDGEPLSDGAFPKASVWARISTVLAGPIFNFILGFVLAVIIVAYAGSDRPVVQGIMDGYPAQEAGMQSGDMITRMNGEKVYVSREITLNTYINQNAPIEVEFIRDGEKHTVTLQPKYSEENGRYLIGLQGYGEYVDGKGLDLFRYSYYELRYCLKSTVKSLGMLLQGKASMDDVAGPVGMVQVIGEVKEETKQYGTLVVVINMINIAMLLSVNLGVMNLLPIPALDGGRLVFLIIEAVSGKALPPEKEGIIHFAGFVAVIILMVLVMFNDISRLFR